MTILDSPRKQTDLPRWDARLDLRGIVSIVGREVTRFWRNRIRILTSLAQPLVFLFILGTGLSPVVDSGSAAVDFRAFLFPGILGMTVLFAGLFSAMSIVWDREFGFLREMLVAPISRWAVVVGKCIGGALVASAQALLMLAVAPLAGIPLTVPIALLLIAQVLVIALAFTAFGITIATFVERIESFPMISQFVVLPMFFLSSAFFPVANLPVWLQVGALLNPMSYAVDALRRAAFAGIDPAQLGALRPGLSWGDWTIPVPLELLLVATFGAVALAISVVRFSRLE